MPTDSHPWKKRQEIPDPQVRDAADQFNEARRLLAARPPGSGLLLPLMHAAIIAVELYLKSLSSSKVHSIWSVVPTFFTVHAKPDQTGHNLVRLLDAIPEDVRLTLEQEFMEKSADKSSLRDVLKTYEGLFMVSRYPFEKGGNISRYDLHSLMRLTDFLGAFIARLRGVDRIHWS